MCLIAFAWNQHPRWPLVLCANRDEFHERPSATLDRWPDAPHIVGGRDLRAGGGWLALGSGRRLAAVTNVREPQPDSALASRGALVRGYLESGLCAAAYADSVRVAAADYGPFNLLLWDGDELIHASNRPVPAWCSVAQGLHALSNGTLDSPWPKSLHLSARLAGWLDAVPQDSAAPDPAALFEALADRRLAPDEALPDTGIGLARERLLSPAFIALPGYGTRASTVVLIGNDGRARMIERAFDGSGHVFSERALLIDLQHEPLDLRAL